MEVKTQPSLRFLGVDFPDVSVQSIKPYDPERSGVKISISVNPRVFLPKDDPGYFKIIMDVSVEAPEYFTLKLIAIGEFNIDGDDITPEIRRALININSPAIMFPYVRSFISTLTANLGKVTTSLIIPPHQFTGKIEIEGDDEVSELEESDESD